MADTERLEAEGIEKIGNAESGSNGVPAQSGSDGSSRPKIAGGGPESDQQWLVEEHAQNNTRLARERGEPCTGGAHISKSEHDARDSD